MTNPGLVTLVVVASMLGVGDAAGQPAAQRRPALTRVAVPVAAVTVDDGDTVEIRWTPTDIETVRILGIDAPETRHLEHNIPFDQPFGPEARAFGQGVLATARDVVILRAATTDPFGRSLAYLLVDGRNYSVLMVSARLAVESVTAFGDNGLPMEAAAVMAAAKVAGPVAFEPPHAYRSRMRDVAEWLKARRQYPPP